MKLNDAAYAPLAMSNSESSEEKLFSVARTKRMVKKTRKAHSSKGKSLRLNGESNCLAEDLGCGYQEPAIKYSNLRNKLGIFFSFVCLIWLVILTWFAFSMHSQDFELKTAINTVAAGSRGLPDAIQECHSMSSSLQANQTLLFSRLTLVNSSILNISNQIMTVHGELAVINDKLNKTLLDSVGVPANILSLPETVASFGSHIQDLQVSLNQLKKEQERISMSMQALSLSLTTMNATVKNFVNSSKEFQNFSQDIGPHNHKFELKLQSLNDSIKEMNSSVNGRIYSLEQNQKSDHSSIDSLNEMNENINSRISTIQNDLNDKQSTLVNLTSGLMNITNLKMDNNRKFDDIDRRLTALSVAVNSSANLTREMDVLKNQLNASRNSQIENSSSKYTNNFNTTLH